MTSPSRLSLFQYSVLAFPLAFSGMPLYIHAPDYYTTKMELSLTSIGVVLLFLRFADAISDPIMGYYSDRYSHKKRPFMMIALLGLCLSFFGLFYPMGGVSPLLWFGIMIFLSTSFFSFLTLNLGSLGSLWKVPREYQTSIHAAREGMGLLGLLFAVTIPFILKINFDMDNAFIFTSLILFLVSVISCILFSNWYKKSEFTVLQKQSKFSFSVLTQPFIIFYSICFLSVLASSVPAILVLFYVRDLLGSEALAGLFLCLYFIMGTICMPLWRSLGNYFSKYMLWMSAMIISVVLFGWCFYLGPGDYIAYGIICIISGIGFGAKLSLPPSILADYISSEDQQENASFFYSILQFLSKLSLAIVTVVIFPFLEYAGFMAGQENSESALWSLRFSYAIIPVIIQILAIILIVYYHQKGNLCLKK